MSSTRALQTLISLALLLSASAATAEERDPSAQPLHGLRPGYPATRVEVDTSVHPWSAVGRVNVAGQRYCSGTLVNERVVVTAAHCLWNPRTRSFYPTSYIHFVAGYQRDNYPAHSTAAELRASPDYVGGRKPGPETFAGDWALIRLAEPIGRDVGWVGWARFDASIFEQLGGRDRDYLLAGYRADRRHVLAVDRECGLDGLRDGGRLIHHRCASIQGDSGGPLLLKARGGHFLVGINVGMQREPEKQAVSMAVPLASFFDALSTLSGPPQKISGSPPLLGRKGAPPGPAGAAREP